MPVLHVEGEGLVCTHATVAALALSWNSHLEEVGVTKIFYRTDRERYPFAYSQNKVPLCERNAASC